MDVVFGCPSSRHIPKWRRIFILSLHLRQLDELKFGAYRSLIITNLRENKTEILTTYKNGSTCKNNRKQDRQCTHNVILSRVHVTIVVVKEYKYYIFWDCVCSLSYPPCKAHAPYYIVICGLSGCTIFSHIVSKTARFSGEKINEHKMCVLIFSINFVCNISHSKTTQRDAITNLHRSSRNYPVFSPFFKRTWIFSTDIQKILKHQISRKSFHWEPTCSLRTDGQTWRS
jgi:hypothetical protein